MDHATLAQQRVGATLCNTWRLERLLGVGSVAAVYAAVHTSGKREAVKLLHADVAEIPGVRDRFAESARQGGRVRHPGAVEIREVREDDDGAPFVVMELLTGEPLAAVASRRGGVATGELLRLTDDLLDVLAAAHAEGVIHGGVTPENLFIEKGGKLKVLDFSLARVGEGLPAPVRSRLGLAPDMAPEQAQGLALDARADLFAVGATMFRAVARRRVHEAASAAELLVKMANEPARELASVARGASRDLALIVDRALMFDRARRYPDARVMQGDVRALRAGEPPPFASARRDEPQGEVQIVEIDDGAGDITVPRMPGLAAQAVLAAKGALAGATGLPKLRARDSEAPDTPTRIAKTVIRPPMESLAAEVTTMGGDLGTRPTMEAPPPKGHADLDRRRLGLPKARLMDAPETPTVARKPGEVFVPGTEPTLESHALPSAQIGRHVALVSLGFAALLCVSGAALWALRRGASHTRGGAPDDAGELEGSSAIRASSAGLGASSGAGIAPSSTPVSGTGRPRGTGAPTPPPKSSRGNRR